MMRVVFWMPKKSRITPWSSYQNVGRFWVQDHKKSGMAMSTIKKGQWNCTANKMTQRFKETGHPIFKSTSALSRGLLKHKKGLFQTVYSVNQLSVYGAVANWCYQFGSTEDEKGRASTAVDNKILTKLKTEEIQLLVSSEKSNWKQDARKSPELRRNDQSDTSDTIMWKDFLPISCGRREAVENSTKCRRRMEKIYSSVSRILEFSILSENQSIVGYSRRHHYWTSFRSSRCQNSWQILQRSCNSLDYKPRILNSRCYIQRSRAFSEWNSWSQTRAQVQQWITRKPSRIRKEWRRKSNQKPPGTWAAPNTKETGADPVVLAPRASPFTNRTIFTIWRRFGSVSLQIGCYDASTLWPRWTTTWWFETLGDYETSIDESVCTQRSSRLWWWILVTPDSWGQY